MLGVNLAAFVPQLFLLIQDLWRRVLLFRVPFVKGIIQGRDCYAQL